jgi:iron complex transport system substrate-binding protein
MRKNLSVILIAAAAVSLVACGNNTAKTNASAAVPAAATETAAENGAETAAESDAPETVTITSLDANGESVDLTVTYDPQRVAILDMAALDILGNLGLENRVVGSASTSLDYLKAYTENVQLLGTIKEADLEAVMACEPDVIFIGGRLSSSYDALSEIAPVVYLATDAESGVVASTRRNAEVIASIFGKEDEVAEKFDGFGDRIAALQEIADGKTAVVGMSTSGSFNVLGNNGRCSIIGKEIGFENLNAAASEASGKGKGAGDSKHGNESSFELIVSQNPDYIFVMDRDAAIGTEGAQLAADIMDNELIHSTDAYNNGNLVILENSSVWYTAEGGVTALDIMLSDLENVLVK